VGVEKLDIPENQDKSGIENVQKIRESRL
jgi:hypothetical protein